jgi:hypothetical protein
LVTTTHCLSAPSREHAAPTAEKADATTPRPSLIELPSDRQMIDHFRTNRATFSEVVRLHQTDKYAARAMLGAAQLGDASKYKDLLHSVGIARIAYDGAAWPPDPYSFESARRMKDVNPFNEFAYQGLFLEPLGTEYRKTSQRLRAYVWKQYFYVPVIARVADGRLWWPVSNFDGQLHRSERVVSTLDEYPSHWVRRPWDERLSECVFRQFEPQWFLKMCIST